MIRLDDVTVRLGPRIVLDGASWALREGARVGIVGRNGAGKTTLLRLLAGDISAESGQVHRRGGVRMAWLHQQAVTVDDRPVVEAVREGMTGLLALEATLRRAEAAVAGGEPDASEALDTALEAFRHAGGFQMDERIGEVLHGLGFAPEDATRSCTAFSGGWRMRIALARFLLADVDLRLLDEPTNHLDWPARTWLAGYLAQVPGTLVVVSHDRWLLDRIASETVEIRGGRLTAFRGTPSVWMAERAQREARDDATRSRVDAEAARLEAFIDRFGASATKAAAARNAQKRLDRLERPDEVVPDMPDPRLVLPDPPPSSTELVTLRGAAFGHPDGPTWSRVDWTVARGERWAVIGPNGAGKSTLLHALLGRLPLSAGRRLLGRDVIAALHAQDLAAALPADASGLDVLRAACPAHGDTRLRAALGALGLAGEAHHQRIGVLSGGQKARVVLARFLLEPANLLLLDEPTNHLDVPTAEALAAGLEAWPGGLVVVTHDRWLVERIATRLVVVRDGAIEVRDRVTPALLDLAAQPGSRRDTPSGAVLSEAADARDAQKERRRMARQLERLHATLDALSAEIAALDEAMFAQAADPAAAARLAAERDAAEAKLESAFEEAASLEAALS